MNSPGDPTDASPARRPPTLRPIVWADVTNTVASSGTTGVQRASKNLLAPLADRDPRLDLRLIRWCPECAAFLRLDDDERRRFSDDAPPPDRRVDRLPQRIRPVARRVADRPLLRRLNEAMRRRRRPPHPVDAHAGLTVSIDDGTFLDLDAAWHNPLDRRDLLPALSAAGVRTAVLFHDLFPIDHPEWSDRGTRELFPPWADAHLRFDALIVGNSDWTLQRALDRRQGIGLPDPGVSGVVHLSGDGGAGRDEPVAPQGPTPTGARPGLPPQLQTAGASERRLDGYVICVSTLEPRKNHQVLLDAFDLWSQRTPCLGLVFVGRIGWNTEALVRRIERHPLLGSQLFWFAHADDETMRTLLGGATVAAMPSHAEGFGLPVLEALALGVPVVTTNGGALGEVGGDVPLRLAADDSEAWADALVRHLADEDYLRTRRAEARRAAGALPTWSAARDELVELLTRLAPPS